MTTEATLITEKAKALPEQDRAELVQVLIESLSTEAKEPNYDQLWDEEIAKRIEGIDSGTTRLVPFEDGMESIRKARKQ